MDGLRVASLGGGDGGLDASAADDVDGIREIGDGSEKGVGEVELASLAIEFGRTGEVLWAGVEGEGLGEGLDGGVGAVQVQMECGEGDEIEGLTCAEAGVGVLRERGLEVGDGLLCAAGVGEDVGDEKAHLGGALGAGDCDAGDAGVDSFFRAALDVEGGEFRVEGPVVGIQVAELAAVRGSERVVGFGDSGIDAMHMHGACAFREGQELFEFSEGFVEVAESLEGGGAVEVTVILEGEELRIFLVEFLGAGVVESVGEEHGAEAEFLATGEGPAAGGFFCFLPGGIAFFGAGKGDGDVAFADPGHCEIGIEAEGGVKVDESLFAFVCGDQRFGFLEFGEGVPGGGSEILGGRG